MLPAKSTDAKMRKAALDSLAQIFESIVEILFISGISVQDACQLLRSSAVKTAARRLQIETGRESKSRVAIATGLSRSEVARLWKKGSLVSAGWQLSESRSQRIIDAWFGLPEFLSQTGEPVPIPIFGRRRSLEHLVRLHGGGVPTRAMLDELLSIEAVVMEDNQTIRVKSRVAVNKGVNASSLQSVGARASDLLSTLVHNLTAERAHFEAGTLVQDVDPDLLPLIRREVANRGSSFLGNIDELLCASKRTPNESKRKANRNGVRAGVGVFYFEKRPTLGLPISKQDPTRKNLKRAAKHSNSGKKSIRQ